MLSVISIDLLLVCAAIVGACFLVASLFLRRVIRQRDEAIREKADLVARNQYRKEERKALQSVIEREAHGILVFDLEGRMTYANATIERMLGFWKEDLLGDSYHKVFVDDTLRKQGIDLIHQRYSKSVERFEVTGYQKDGAEIPLEVAFTELDTPQGKHLVVFVWDITKRKQEEAELREALAEAKIASSTKSAFLANMSHELRTPMTAIIGLSELCLRTDLDDAQVDYLTKLHHTARSLLVILNDVLDLSKIEAGELSVEYIPFRIDDVLEDLGNVMQHSAFEKRLELLFVRQSDVPNQIIGDPSRLKQVLINLCSNAIKFTEVGDVVVEVRCEAHNDHEAKIEFCVQDSGIGMTNHQQAALFRPFTQADSSTSRKYGGTGLGLSISKHLVEVMGGKIKVASEPGRGSMFSFSLDVEITDPSDVTALSSALTGDALRGMTALIVDDNDKTGDVLKQYLQDFGMEAETTTSREAAIERALEQPFDLILFDNFMPRDLSITECVEGVGRDYLKQSRLIVMVEDRAQIDDGANLASAIMSKPVTPSGLLEVIAGTFGYGQKSRKSPKQHNAIDKDLSGVRVLLVEDNVINQQVALELLQQAGVQVEVAGNGVEALLMLYKHEFDCVLMDIQMPEMDGLEASRRIRQRKNLKDLPILAMTANLMLDRKEAAAAGMNGHIAKPIDSEALLSTLKRAVGIEEAGQLRRARLNPDKDIALDRERGLGFVGGNKALYERLLRDFSMDHAADPDLIAQLIEAGDFVSAHRVSHTLKGLAQSLGAVRCARYAVKVDGALAEQRVPPPELLQKLSVQLAEVVREIRHSQVESETDACALDQDGLSTLRRLIEEMNPDAEETFEQLASALSRTDRAATEELAQYVRNFDFEHALIALNTIEKTLSQPVHLAANG